jgi:hypothetical protein
MLAQTARNALCAADSLDAIWLEAQAARLASRAWSQRIHILGESNHLAPLDGLEKLQHNVSAAALDRAVWLRLPDWRWHRAFGDVTHERRRVKPLKVTILGASVAAGCGALSPSIRCEPQLSWARRLHDLMQSVLHSVHSRIDASGQSREGYGLWRTALWARGAVGPEAFGMCLGEKIDKDTNVVLFDFEPNLQMASTISSGAGALEKLRQQAASAAPHAVFVFVGWPAFKARHYSSLVEHANNRSGQMDGLGVARLLHEVPGLQQNARAGYNDLVHPSAAGHELIAQAVGRLLTRRLISRICEAPAAPASLANSEQQHAEDTVSHLGNATVARQLEWCHHAQRAPVRQPLTGWAMRDEAGDKGLPKFGYVSTHVGSTLTFGPLVPEVECGVLRADVGYLQSWRPTQGIMQLQCWGGCTCIALPGNWAKAYPFPKVDTWMPSVNATITTVTSFMLWKQTGDCFLNVTHRLGSALTASANTTTSHVRVDQLSMSALDCTWSCFAKLRAQSLLAQQFGEGARRCAHGAAGLGLPAHVGPECLASANSSAAGTKICRDPAHLVADYGFVYT